MANLGSSELSHRTWPLPWFPSVMRMKWHRLLFLHWKVDAKQIEELIPTGLKVDLFQGEAWIGLVPFYMTGIGPHYVPPLPGLSAFPELNVRTYVTDGGKPGVWFFSLDATHRIAVRFARTFFHLKYMDAEISMSEDRGDEDWIEFSSRRFHRGEPPGEFQVRYRPIGEERITNEGTLEHWLTARYCMYMESKRGNIYRGEIDHPPWRIRDAEAMIQSNSMTRHLGIDTETTSPIAHYAHLTPVRAWYKQRVY